MFLENWEDLKINKSIFKEAVNTISALYFNCKPKIIKIGLKHLLNIKNILLGILVFFFLNKLKVTFWGCNCHFVLPSLEPEWAAAATAVKDQTKGKVRLGAVDATVHQVVSGRYGVSKI